MPSLISSHDLRPRNHRGLDKSLGLLGALAMHGVLITGLITVFQWRTDAQTYYAELWAPEDVSAETAGQLRELPTEKEPIPQPEPEPEKAPERALPETRVEPPPAEPDNALEQAAREDENRLEQEMKRLDEERMNAEIVRQERLRQEKERIEQEKRLAEEKRIAEEKRLEEALLKRSASPKKGKKPSRNASLSSCAVQSLPESPALRSARMAASAPAAARPTPSFRICAAR